MTPPKNRTAQLILLSLFVTAFGNSSMIPYMGYFIVQELGMKPWHITVYSVLTSLLTMFGTRLFGERIDRSEPTFRYMFLGNLGLVIASGVAALFKSYLLLLLVVSPGLALAGAGMSSAYTFGRLYAERTGLNLARYNAYVRTMISLGWMFGPALSYVVAARYSNMAVFQVVFVISLLSMATSWFSLPHDFRAEKKPPRQGLDEAESTFANRPLWLAAGACFLFSMAHVLCAAALPLFYIREAHLPIFAPGLSLTLKCFAEVFAILASPMVMARLGKRNALYLSGGAGIVAFCVLHQATSLGVMAVGALMEGFYFGLFAGVAVTFMQGFGKGRIGRATSLYMNSLFLGSLVASMGVGVIASAVDFRSAIVVAGFAMVLALAMLFFTRRSDAAAEPG
jgi:SET family sugar efflux transporter-like MFS transporter